MKKRKGTEEKGMLFNLPAQGRNNHSDFSLHTIVGLGVCFLMSCLFVSTQVSAAVQDVTITDVTTRAFSVVWVSDESVDSATVRVFNDPDGLNEITSTLSVTLVSTAFPPALEQGVVKVDVTGLSDNATIYVQTETSGLSGLFLFPESTPLLEVHTAVEAINANDLKHPITNDLIKHEMVAPDGQTPAEGGLLIVKLPSISPYPLTAFVGKDFASPASAVDLNNLFDAGSGKSADLAANTVIEITEFRGLSTCTLDNHKLLRFRRVPVHEETPKITEVESPAACFFADTVCDDVIDIVDVQRVLNLFNEALGSCVFNSDLDVVNDGVIDILDVQSVLNRFGQSAPFAE